MSNIVKIIGDVHDTYFSERQNLERCATWKVVFRWQHITNALKLTKKAEFGYRLI
jgi:hypothetical protein